MRGRGAAGSSAGRGAPARRGGGRLCPAGRAEGRTDGRRDRRREGGKEARPLLALPSPAPAAGGSARGSGPGPRRTVLLIFPKCWYPEPSAVTGLAAGRSGASPCSGLAVTAQGQRTPRPVPPAGLVGALVLAPGRPRGSAF